MSINFCLFVPEWACGKLDFGLCRWGKLGDINKASASPELDGFGIQELILYKKSYSKYKPLKPAC